MADMSSPAAKSRQSLSSTNPMLEPHELMSIDTKEAYAFPIFEAVFKEFGLPKAIRTDNGVPFASPHALYGLSKLSVRWLRLGIEIERIKPGHPQQNGRHERMHLTLKLETTQAGRQQLSSAARQVR
jgi:putative transposase